jgi:hypothetical protein
MRSLSDIAKQVIPASVQPAAKVMHYRLLTPSRRRARIAGQLRSQARICGAHGSPLYASLLEHAAGDVERSGPSWRALSLEGATALGADDALALRFMGAIHRLVLTGSAPALAAHYPSVGGDGDARAACGLFSDVVEQNAGSLGGLMRQGVQTNEVGRCALLTGGFLLVARETGLPIHVLEMGASAGLNLRWDRYRYDCNGLAWGDPSSPVRLGSAIVAGTPPYDVETEVVGRAGCDLAPIDPSSADGVLTLTSLVWADQRQRLEDLRGALSVVRDEPVTVEQADGPTWVAKELETTREGVATIVFHSFVLQFIDRVGRERLTSALAAAGERATTRRPVAWLRLEWGGDRGELRLTVWPDGTDRLLAVSSPHGANAEWLA